MFYRIQKYLEEYVKLRNLALVSWQTIAPTLVSVVFKKRDFFEDEVHENINIYHLKTT